MRARCRREGLLSACQLASAALPAREVKPILRNLKAVAGDGRCTLMATDLEVGIRLDVQGLTIEEPGEAILPAARLIAILREATDEELSIEADQTACVVRGPTLEFEMPGEDPAQFPEWPTFTEEKYHEISAGSLREMIRRTLFAVADETGRYSMTGVLWDMDGDTTRLVGSDGYRLALAQGTATSHGGHTTKGQQPVVPTKAMSLLERNLQDDPEEAVKICLRPNDVLFRTERAVLYSRLVEGRYPDYRQIFPKKPAVEGDGGGGAVVVGGEAGGRHGGQRDEARGLPLRQEQADAGGPGGDDGPVEGGAAGRLRGQADGRRLQPAIPGGDAQGGGAGRRAGAGPDRRRDAGVDPLRVGLLVFGGADQPEGGAGVRRCSASRGVSGRSADRDCDASAGALTPPLARPWEEIMAIHRDPAPRGPENLGEILSRLFTARGWGRRQGRLHLEKAWAEAAGPDFAAQTRVAALRRGVLEVVVGNAVLLQELAHFHKRRLLEQLRGRLPNTP